MKIELTEDEIQKLYTAQYECNAEQVTEIIGSLPLDAGTWVIPDFAVEIVRDVAFKFIDPSIYEKMEKQTIRGTIKLNLSGANLND